MAPALFSFCSAAPGVRRARCWRRAGRLRGRRTPCADNMAEEGWTADKVFDCWPSAFGLDSVAFLPGHPICNLENVDVSTRLTRNVTIGTPLVGGPTDSVTDANMAIALALSGGIGIIHRSQSAEAQAEMVKHVKRYESGFILDPMTLGKHHTVKDVDQIRERWGCSAIPITDTGKMGGKLLGLVTSRDIEAVSNRNSDLGSIMSRNLVLAQEPVTLREARDKMQRAKVGKLPVVNDDMEIVALICRGDLKKARHFPNAARDANKQLLVGASVAAETEEDWERAKLLLNAGVDVINVDVDSGVTDRAVEFVRRLKEEQSTDLIVGRLNSTLQAEELATAGADAFRVGTIVGDAPGRSEATHIYELAKYLRLNFGIPVIADAGVRSPAQMLKALCLGASSVIIDDLLVGTEEAPGDHFYRDGVRMKLHSSTSSSLVPQKAVSLGESCVPLVSIGLAGQFVDKGSVMTLVPHFTESLRRGVREIGLAKICELANALHNGMLRLERQMPPGAQTAEQPRVLRAAGSPLTNYW